jgi:hypothetical protein
MMVSADVTDGIKQGEKAIINTKINADILTDFFTLKIPLNTGSPPFNIRTQNTIPLGNLSNYVIHIA